MKVGGYFLVTPEGAGPVQEYDTITCCHCNRIVLVQPGTWGKVYLIADDSPQGYHLEPGAFCAKCYGPICLPCDNGTCTPFEARLDHLEAAARRRG